MSRSSYSADFSLLCAIMPSPLERNRVRAAWAGRRVVASRLEASTQETQRLGQPLLVSYFPPECHALLQLRARRVLISLHPGQKPPPESASALTAVHLGPPASSRIASVPSSHLRHSLQYSRWYQNHDRAPDRRKAVSPSASSRLQANAALKLSCSASNRSSQNPRSLPLINGSTRSASSRKNPA